MFVSSLEKVDRRNPTDNTLMRFLRNTKLRIVAHCDATHRDVSSVNSALVHRGYDNKRVTGGGEDQEQNKLVNSYKPVVARPLWQTPKQSFLSARIILSPT